MIIKKKECGECTMSSKINQLTTNDQWKKVGFNLGFNTAVGTGIGLLTSFIIFRRHRVSFTAFGGGVGFGIASRDAFCCSSSCSNKNSCATKNSCHAKNNCHNNSSQCRFASESNKNKHN